MVKQETWVLKWSALLIWKNWIFARTWRRRSHLQRLLDQRGNEMGLGSKD